MNWSALLSYEFNEQAKLQKKNGLEVTECLVYKGRKQFYKGQVNFISRNEDNDRWDSAAAMEIDFVRVEWISGDGGKDREELEGGVEKQE